MSFEKCPECQFFWQTARILNHRCFSCSVGTHYLGFMMQYKFMDVHPKKQTKRAVVANFQRMVTSQRQERTIRNESLKT